MPRYAARIDANQKEIVDALRGHGAFVQPLHTVGDGVPDLLVGYRLVTLLLEVKDGKKPPSERQLTDDQLKFHREWKGGLLAVVSDVQSALGILRAIDGVAGGMAA